MAFILLSRLAACLGFRKKEKTDDDLTERLNSPVPGSTSTEPVAAAADVAPTNLAPWVPPEAADTGSMQQKTPEQELCTPVQQLDQEQCASDTTDKAVPMMPGESARTPAKTPLGPHNSPGSSTFAFHPQAATPALPPLTTTIMSFEGTPISTPAGPFKFLFETTSTPHIAGIPNTVHKFAADQPVRLHSTPIEQRIDRTLEAEQRAIHHFRQRAQRRNS